jgi:ubiquinone biosynthesis protein
MPNMLHDIMQQTTQHKLKMQWESQQLEALRKDMQQAQRTNRLLIIGGLLLFFAYTVLRT